MKGAAIAGLLMTVVFAGCAPVAQPSAELSAFDDAWEAAFNSGDVAKVVELYTEDARLLPPNTEMSSGSAAVEAAFVEMIASGVKIDLDSVDAMAAGDLGYSVGTYRVTATSGDVVDHGKYVEVLRKVGGQWKIADDTWNSDLPAQPAGTQLIFTHRVKDNDVWLAAWSGENSRETLFAEHGAPSVKIFAAAGDPSHHALLVGVTDMDAFKAWINSDEAAAAKAEDGVLDEGFTVFEPVE